MNDIIRWFSGQGIKSLREIGVQKGQTVLDFGCGSGAYTVPAAQIVGSSGRVYGVDREWHSAWSSARMQDLAQRIRAHEIHNILLMKTSGELSIALENRSVDVVLLYDILHSYYFYGSADRAPLLHEVHRVLKSDGFLSFYAGDPDLSHDYAQIREIKRDIENAGFHLESERTVQVIHENQAVKGHITNFKKVHPSAPKTSPHHVHIPTQ